MIENRSLFWANGNGSKLYYRLCYRRLRCDHDCNRWQRGIENSDSIGSHVTDSNFRMMVCCVGFVCCKCVLETLKIEISIQKFMRNIFIDVHTNCPNSDIMLRINRRKVLEQRRGWVVLMAALGQPPMANVLPCNTTTAEAICSHGFNRSSILVTYVGWFVTAAVGTLP
jgi:hypothetical protein